MLDLKKKIFYFTFFLDRPPARIWVQIQIFSKKKKIFTIFHIEFAEKSQKIRTVALWYKKLYQKKKKKNRRGGNRPTRP